MFGPCFVVHYFVTFLVCNNLAEEQKSGSFTLNAFKCHLTVSVLCLFLTVLCVSLHCVIVSFPGHIHLFLHVILLRSSLEIHAASTVSRTLL